MPNKSAWRGDKSNGVEYRWQDDDLDEVLLWIDGKCVMHAERMDDEFFWIGLYAGDVHDAIYAGSTSGRADVELWGDTWGKGGRPDA